MRPLVMAVLVPLAGCQVILGIEDPVGDRCSPFDSETCDPDESCDLSPELLVLDCRAAGQVQIGLACSTNEADNMFCVDGATCADNVCHSFCDTKDAECPGSEGRCVYELGPYDVCDNDCDIFDRNNPLCPVPGFECILTQNSRGSFASICVPPGYFTVTGLGMPCQSRTDCGAGNTCDEQGTCRELCSMPGSPCGTAGTCQEAFKPQLIHDTTIGVCIE